MRDYESDREQRNLSMQMVDHVFAPGGGDVAESRRETELQPHHREAGIADCDRELRPEVARGGQGPDQEREQGGEHKNQIDGHPRPAAQGEAQLSNGAPGPHRFALPIL